MSAGTEYANRLELWFQSTPGIVQEVLRPLFNQANDALKSVAGDPEDLVRAGQRYVDLSRALVEVAEQQGMDRRMLVGAWDGEGYDAFSERANYVEQQLGNVAEVTGGTQEVLHAAADACVQGANLIIDIVLNLIAFAIGTLVIKAALAVFTFGASVAAGAAIVIAKGVAALARIVGVLSKVGTFLTKVANFLKQLSLTLKNLSKLFHELRLLLKQLDELKKAAKAAHGTFSKAHAAAMGVRGLGYGVTNHALLGGNVPRPLGTMVDTAKDVRDTVDAVRDVNDAAER